MDKTNRQQTAYLEELKEVQKQLLDAADDIHAPLDELVRSQVHAAAPYLRGALVLATCVSEENDEFMRAKRISLAAALEMLSIAQGIHNLLLKQDARELDKSILGSTILAGDYCFSRSATMAVRTDTPRVVEIFSEALGTISEGVLRLFFDEPDLDFSEDLVLFNTGIDAASVLLSLPDTASAHLRFLAECLNRSSTQHSNSAPCSELLDRSMLTASQAERWALLLQWLESPQSSKAPFTPNGILTATRN